MNNPSDVKATDKDWASFRNHRKAKDGGSKKVIWPYLALAFFFLSLIASNAFWIMKDNNVQRVNNHSDSAIDTVYITKYIETSNGISVSKKETTRLANLTKDLELITNQYQNLQHRLNNQSVQLSELQFYNDGMEDKYATLYNQWSRTHTLAIEKQDLFNENSTVRNPVFETKLEERLFVEIIGKLPSLPFQNIAYHSNAQIYPSRIFIVKNEKPFNLLDAITPKSFSINGNVAYAFYGTKNNYTGLGFDLRATTLFSNSVRGYTGFTFMNGQSRLEDDGMTNPVVPYPMLIEGDRIEHSDKILSQLSVNVGLEYLCNLEGRWRPYAGLGYGRILSNTTKYKFEIKTSNGSEYYIAPEGRFTQKNFNQMILTLGTDFNVSNRIDMRLGLNYAHALTDRNNSTFLLKGGAYYHF